MTVNNELLTKINEYQSTSSLNPNKCNEFTKREDSLEEVNQSETYFDSLTFRTLPIDENKELKEINEITSKYCPVPIEEDNNNVIIRYLRHDKTLSKMVRNTIPWKQRLTISGERYYLMIQSHKIDRVWEIKLMRYLQGSMPPTYKLKAITDKGKEFDSNKVIANGNTQSISLFIKLELGEGLKFEIYPSPEDYDYSASRVFWFY